MQTYVSLLHFTQEGAQSFKKSTSVFSEMKAIFQKKGIQLKGFYMLMGKYDAVIILEAPDDESVAHAAMEIGAKGSIRTETVRAFTEDQYLKLLGIND